MPLIIPENENLVTYYMLPLVGVNYKVFGKKFKTSYVSRTQKLVFVHLTSPMESLGYTKTATYKTTLTIKKNLLVVYTVPEIYLNDLELFIQGQYSRMSKEAKKVIYTGSGLKYNATIGDFKVSSPILQALDKTKTLRDFLFKSIGVETLLDSVELIDTPSDWWFVENL